MNFYWRGGKTSVPVDLGLGRAPSERERAIVGAACERELRQFAENREAANQLIHVGASPPPVDVDIAELAAWTMMANLRDQRQPKI